MNRRKNHTCMVCKQLFAAYGGCVANSETGLIFCGGPLWKGTPPFQRLLLKGRSGCKRVNASGNFANCKAGCESVPAVYSYSIWSRFYRLLKMATSARIDSFR